MAHPPTGWISPAGDWHPVRVGGAMTHDDWALQNHELVDKHGGLRKPYHEYEYPDEAQADMVRAGWIRKAAPSAYAVREQDRHRVMSYVKRHHPDLQRDLQLDVHRKDGGSNHEIYQVSDGRVRHLRTSVIESLQGTYLSEPRRDSENRQLMHFDIMHPEHGKIGVLSGGRVRVGGKPFEYEPGVEYARTGRRTKVGAKTSFQISDVRVHPEAIARIHGVQGYNAEQPQKSPEAARRVRELEPHVLGPATIRDLGRQLKKKARVSMVGGGSIRTSGVVRKHDNYRVPSPVPFRESRADVLIRRKLNEIAKPVGTGFAKMTPTQEVPDVVRQRTYYHGVASEKDAQAILRDGVLVPGNRPGRGALHPLPGRVYLTPSPGDAVGHAVNRLPNDSTRRDAGKGYGYVFKVEGSELHHASADEDRIGELAHFHYGDHRNQTHADVYRLGQQHLSPSEREDVNDTECSGSDCLARVGKKLSKRLTVQQHHAIISEPGAVVAHHGPVRITGAWRVPRGHERRLSGEWRSQVLQHGEPIHHLIGRK